MTLGTDHLGEMAVRIKDASVDGSTISVEKPIPATRKRLRVKQRFHQNRVLFIGAGALVVALLLFVIVSVPNKGSRKLVSELPARNTVGTDKVHVEEHSLLPIVDAGQTRQAVAGTDLVNEEAVERTANRTSDGPKPSMTPKVRERTLAAIPDFPESWQAPPYSGHSAQSQKVPDNPEREVLQKSSFAFVRSVPKTATGTAPPIVVDPGVEQAIGLPVGARLFARLESSASTGLQAPVVAVVQYNYEHNGEMLVPAGSRVIGHIQQAAASGYMTIQFETLIFPDDSSVPLEAVATDLKLGPPRGRVQGKNGGKNLLLRSLSGIGQVGALLVGRGGLSQPLSEEDMLRERVSNNIGEASDQQISHLALSERVVVTIPAATPIYVVVEKRSTAKTAEHVEPKGTSSNAASADELRELLQLQKELQTRQ